MRLGFALPQFGAQTRDAREVARFAAEAEGLGAASLWAADRLLAPVRPSVPYGNTGGIPAEFRRILDPFILLTAAAAATEHAVLGTSVLNAPWYPPAVLARSLTSIDLLSGGRLLPGFGTGWMPEEFQAVNVPIEERGRRLDECLDVLLKLWTEERPEYHGRLWRLPATHNDLRPAQQPRPPVYLGGFGGAALRRIGRRGDGWLPVAVVGGRAGFDPVRLRALRAVIDEEARAAGRDPAEIGAVLRINVPEPVPAEEIAAVARTAREQLGMEHAFVDHGYVAEGVDQALELAGELLALLAKG